MQLPSRFGLGGRVEVGSARRWTEMSILFGRARRSETLDLAERLHDDLVAAIRNPVFYLSDAVPDTFEGRFDLLVLHVALLLRRLRNLEPEGPDVAQHLVDTMFRRFDIAMRELGVSDIGVPKRMKRLAEAFKGRSAAYNAALDADDGHRLALAVARNVLNGQGDGLRLAHYAQAVEAGLGARDLAALRRDGLALPDPALNL